MCVPGILLSMSCYRVWTLSRRQQGTELFNWIGDICILDIFGKHSEKNKRAGVEAGKPVKRQAKIST